MMQGSKSRDDVTASVIPVRLRAGVVALESSFRGGIKRELLRSLCQVGTYLPALSQHGPLFSSLMASSSCASSSGAEAGAASPEVATAEPRAESFCNMHLAS